MPHPISDRQNRRARPLCILGSVVGDLGSAQHHLRRRRSLHPLCCSGIADIRCGAAGLPRGPRRDASGGAALSSFHVARFGPLPDGHGPALWPLRHARHRTAVAARLRGPRRVHCGGIDDDRAPRQDGALSLAPLAPARSHWCTRGCERDPVRPGREGIVLHSPAALVQRPAKPARLCCCTIFGSDECRRDRGRPAAGTPQAARRLFDIGPDRVPLPDVSALPGCPGARSRPGNPSRPDCFRQPPTPPRKRPCF